MGDTNTIYIRGTIVSEVEPVVTSGGKKLVKFRVMTRDGQTNYHSCTAWEDVAEELHRGYKRDSRISFEGRGSSGSYESKKHPGEKVYTYDLIVERLFGTPLDDEADLPTSF